jgi:HK97 family phage major capsid protein
MDKKIYQQQRNELLAAGEEHIKSNEPKKWQEIKAKVEKLDKDFHNMAESYTDLKALEGADILGDEQMAGTINSFSPIGADDNIYNSVEYRKAFMNYAMKGETIPAEFKNEGDELTTTSTAGAVIPNVVLERIIEKMETVGNVFSRVTKTNYKGGVTVPTSSVKPTAVWVTEGGSTDTQKKTTGSIQFSFFKLVCPVAVTLEIDTMALPIFEKTLVNNVTEASIIAIEDAIINGNGLTQPKGVLSETVVSGQGIKTAGGTTLSFADLVNAEGALPQSYEAGAEWFMTKKTFMQFVGITDEVGQPVARTNYGIGGQPERILLGRNVVLVDEYLPSLTSETEEKTVFAFIYNLKDYIFNSNLNMTIRRYIDNKTDDVVTKSILLADGKAIDINSLVTLEVGEEPEVVEEPGEGDGEEPGEGDGI